MTTYTPELDPAVRDRLRDYAATFADDFPQAKPARWAGVYLQGLLRDGERKRIEPLARRVRLRLPEGLTSSDPEQALQPCVNQSPWDEQKVLRHYRGQLKDALGSPQGIFVIDDTSFPKQGTKSVGVQSQYGGALAKKANGQVAVSVHDVSPWGHASLDLRRYLPDVWLTDKRRLDRAGVPNAERRTLTLTKPEIALELLDRVRGEGVPGWAVVTDAGDGVSAAFRNGVTARGLIDMAGVTGDFGGFPERPAWAEPPPGGRSRTATRRRLADGSPLPVALSALAKQVRLRKVTRREGTKGKLSARFAWVRVWPGRGWRQGDSAGARPLWVLIEAQAGGVLTFAFSNLPVGTRCKKAVRLCTSRWPVKQGYQPMKEELGLDHFEGRSWRGLHHHACLVMLAYGFLAQEYRRAATAAEAARKKGGTPA